MKKTVISLFLTGLLITGLTLTSASAGARKQAPCEEPCTEAPCKDSYGYYKGNKRGYLHCVGQVHRFQHKNMFIRVLTQLTGKSEADLKADFQSGSKKTILEKYNISPEKFSAAMKKEAQVYVQNAVSSGSITKEQGDIVLRDLENCYKTP